MTFLWVKIVIFTDLIHLKAEYAPHIILRLNMFLCISNLAHYALINPHCNKMICDRFNSPSHILNNNDDNS